MLTDLCGWRGDVTVTHRTPAGVHVARFANLITNAGLDLLSAALAGTDAEIRYVALGAGSTAPAATDTVLEDEQFRTAVTSQSDAGTGAYDTTAIIQPADATSFEIGEIGWFAGASATGSADTGVLIARVLYSHQKTTLESLQVDRRDTISRA